LDFISYETSQNMLDLLEVNSSRYERVALNASIGRVLFQDIVAEFNDPQFPTASMDGYAVKYVDLEKGELTVLGDNPAGHDEIRVLQEGECIKTFTGSMMPRGADTLIQIENVTYKDGKIIIKETVPLGFSVRPIGEGYKAGKTLITKGTKIGFAEIGVMAGLNQVMVKVAIRPRVAVIATGSEILDLGENSNNPAQIRSSNNYTLAALFEQAGAEVIQLGTAPDNRDAIMHTFQNALANADILVAQMQSKFILALPGFAYSSTVTAILYALPLISKMLGKKEPFKQVGAKLQEDFKKRSPFTEFTACNVVVEDGEYFVNFKDKIVGSSAILTNMLNSSALMVAGEEDKFLEAGTFVNVILLEKF